MTSTVLRAENKKEENIIFISDAHEKFYYEKLKGIRYQDVYHKARCYCLGIGDHTKRNIYRIIDVDTRGVAVYARKSRIANKGDGIDVQFKQCADHVHLSAAIVPKLSISNFMWLK